MKDFKEKEAQSFAEYALLIAITIAFLSAMGVFLQRGLQGKYHDTRSYMMTSVRDTLQDSKVSGVLYDSYEPYYVDTNSVVRSRSDEEVKLDKGGALRGIYQRSFLFNTYSNMASEQLPPGMGSDQ